MRVRTRCLVARTTDRGSARRQPQALEDASCYQGILDRGDHMVQVRAIDGSGQPQTEATAPARPDGATGYHTNRVTIG